MPWPYSQAQVSKTLPGNGQVLCLGFVGRLVEHKGLHVLLEALEKVDSRFAVSLKIAGRVDSDYSQRLNAKYANRAGSHPVEWLGWIGNLDLGAFFDGVDVAVIPSIFPDNTPTTLVESLGNGRPVLSSDLPSLTHLAQPGINALAFTVGDSAALASQIEKLAGTPDLVRSLAAKTHNVLNLRQYALQLSLIYS